MGNAEASAGRSTPRIMPWTIFAVAITAPVLPAETTPCDLAVAQQARSHVDGRIFLGADRLAAESSMVMTSLAW